MADIKQLAEKLRKQGCDAELVQEVIKSLEANVLEETEGRLVRTSKGALMVRVTPSRWPIAMYKKDWKIVLQLVPAIEHALESMNILDENPEKTPKQERTLRSVQVARNQPVREDDEDDLEARLAS